MLPALLKYIDYGFVGTTNWNHFNEMWYCVCHFKCLIGIAAVELALKYGNWQQTLESCWIHRLKLLVQFWHNMWNKDRAKWFKKRVVKAVFKSLKWWLAQISTCAFRTEIKPDFDPKCFNFALIHSLRLMYLKTNN